MELSISKGYTKEVIWLKKRINVGLFSYHEKSVYGKTGRGNPRKKGTCTLEGSLT